MPIFPSRHAFPATQITSSTPTALSATELANPGRGEYSDPGGGNSGGNPVSWPVRDYYARFLWSAIETSAGVYNWSSIDGTGAGTAIREQAIANGGRFWFRIMAQGCGFTACPSFYANATDATTDCPGGVQHPLWNDAGVITALKNLIIAAAAHYNTDTRFLWFEIGLYGDAGEWSNAGGTAMTDANVEALVDQAATSFTSKRVIAMTDLVNATNYAIGLSPTSGKMGVRVDCLGSSIMGGFSPGKYFPGDAVFSVWQNAPVLVEYCSGLGSAGFVRADQYQIPGMHISAAGSWNFGAALDTNGQEGMKKAGYRYQIDSLTVPKTIVRTVGFNVTTVWENVGNAPIYLNWPVKVQLQSTPGGTVVWTGASTLDLRTLVPTTATEIQTLYDGGPSSGTFTLSFGGQTTAAIAFNASAATVQTALQGLSSIGTGNVLCYNGPIGAFLDIPIVFTGTKANAPQALITTGSSTLVGDTVSVRRLTAGIVPTTVSHLDTFTVPGSVTAGSYTISITITDPDGITVPLQLANSSQQADGSYALGTVTVE